ncbi:methyl-accepting chemotaxis protein [Halobaculum sp. MBLA0147]|uniref:methyl-accepting chemotaxis protein n=1 Tax=Halobaculum sp. MBLA0147 TaxID=3079934 RepID=UPI003523E211
MHVSGGVRSAVTGSYTVRLLAVALGIAVIVGAVGVVTLDNVTDRVQTAQRDRVESQAEITAEAVDRWLSAQRKSTRSLSNHRVVNDGEAAAVRDVFGGAVDRLPTSTTAIHLVERRPSVDSAGRNETILVSTSESMEGRQLRDLNSAWPPSVGFNFETVDETLVSWTYSDEGRPTVAVASPTLDGENVVVVEYRTDVQAEQFQAVIDGTDTMVLGDATGLVLLDDNTSNVLTSYRGDAANTTVGARLLDAESGTDVNGSALTDESVVGYADVGQGIGWVVVKEAPRRNAFALVTTVREGTTVIVGAALLGFLALAVVIRRGPVGTIQRLEDRVAALSEGDLSVAVADSERADEVGRLESAVADTHDYLETVAAQADAIAAQRFDDPVLDEEVPGEIGEAMATMRADLESSIAESERNRREAEQLATDLERQAEELARVVGAVADGDLTCRVSSTTETDATTEITAEFNRLLEEIEQSFHAVGSLAADVDTASRRLSELLGEIDDDAADATASAVDIADTTDEQDEAVSEVAGEMSNLSATVEEISASASEIAEESSAVLARGREGLELAEDAIEGMATVDEQTDAAVADVESLRDDIDRVGEVVTLIEDIAAETNTLALNASIEAARAGEAGEGFAVVAEEVKNLAEETEAATEEIGEIIAGVEASTQTTADGIRAVGERVSEQRETVAAAAENVGEIVDRTEELNASVQAIDHATDDQATSTEEVAGMIDAVGDRTGDTADATADLSASLERQREQVADATEAVANLTDTSGSLAAVADEYAVDVDGEPTAPESGGQTPTAADGGAGPGDTGVE